MKRKFQAAVKFVFWKWDNYKPHFKNEGPSNLGHSILDMILDTKSEQTVVTVSYLFNHDSLLQNGKDLITKCDSYTIKKSDIQLPYIFKVFKQ